MVFDHHSLQILARALEKLEAGFSRLPEFSPASAGDLRMEDVLLALAEKLQDNYPYFHPMYAGQMLKPPHPVARLAYSLAMHINPNNHALDGGRATSALEKKRWRRSPRCLVGKNLSDIVWAAVPWPIWRRYG